MSFQSQQPHSSHRIDDTSSTHSHPPTAPDPAGAGDRLDRARTFDPISIPDSPTAVSQADGAA